MSVALTAEMFWNWDPRCCGTRRWFRTHLPHQGFALLRSRLHIDGSRSGEDGFLPGFGFGIAGRIFLPAVEIAAQPLWHRHGLVLDVFISLCYDQLRSLVSCNAAYLAQSSTRTGNIGMPAAAFCGWSWNAVYCLLGMLFHYFWVGVGHRSVTQELAQIQKLVFCDVWTFPCHLFPNPHSV